MEKWKNLKRFLSVLLSISMVVGLMAVVEPRKVEASGENITWEFKSFSGSGELRCTHSDYPSDVASYYSVKAYVDGSVTATTTYLETQYPWDGTNDTVIQGLSASESVYIPAGTILQEYSTATWSEVSGGKTLVLSNALYVVNDNGVWKEADPNALSFSFETVDGSENWHLSSSAVPSYEQYYRFDTVEIDGVEYENAVWLEFTSANSVVIYAGGFETGQGVPQSSFYIPKGTVLYGKGTGTTPWGENTGNDLTVTEDLYVEYINGTWQETAWYPQDHTTMENGGYNMPERAINLISNGDFNSGITNSDCIGNSSVSNKMLSMDITGTDDYFQIYGISLTKGVTYKLTYYMWVSDASNLQYNMYADGAASPTGGWKDSVLTSSISENTEGWQKVEVEWTAPETGEAVFGFKNYNATGSAKIWIDDIALYDTAIPEPVEIEVGIDWISGATIAFTSDLGNEALADIYGSSCDATGSIVVEGQTYTVTYTLSNGQLVIWALPDTYSTASKIQIQEGMELVFPSSSRPLTIKNTLTLGKNAAGDWYVSDVTEHTQLGGNPLPEGKTNLVEGGELNSKITTSDLVNNAEVVEGMVRIDVTGTDDYMQIYGIPVTAQHTYKISYYIWINGANSLEYNMFAVNGTAWKDRILEPDGSLTSDTGEWKKVDFEWTASQTAELVIGFKNYDPNGSAQIYLDDIVVYDTTPNLVESSADMTFSQVVNDIQLEFYVPNDAITTQTDTEDWPSSTASVVINGTEVEVNIYMAPYDAASDNRYFWIRGDAVTAAIATGKIALTGPMVATFDNEKITFNITEGINIEKVGGTWAAYTSVHIYPNNNNVSYYNIDNGTTYVLTSSNNAMEVRKDNAILEVTAGSELSEVGRYDIVRIENNEKFVQQVVLYKNGDANVSGKVDIRDLVAIKKQTADQFVSDLNNDGVVNGEDAAAFRYLIIQKNNAAAFVEEKGNSVLNGVMPIAGFDGPTGTLVNDTVFGYMKELGINTLVHDANDISDVTLGTVPMDNLKLAEKYGIGVYVTDGHIRAGGNYLSTAEMVKRVGLYSAYQSFLGVHVVDEPGTPSYKSTSDKPLANYTDGIKLFKNYANINGYVNSFPYYADDASISETVYSNYLSDVVNAGVDVISYDNYPVGMGKKLLFITTKNTNYKGFYQNLKLARAKSIDSGKPFWTFAQVGDGFTEENTKNIDEKYLPTAAEMQWEINASLAFGSKGIQYYSVVQPEKYAKNTNGSYDYTRSGLISANGEKNARYFDAAKSINKYIATIDEVLMNSENEALIINDENASKYVTGSTGYKEVKSVDGTNALIGCFNYFGKTALLVVNCNVSESQKITVNFNNAQSVKVIEHDCSTDMSNSQVESLALTIGAGQSALVIVED